MVKSYKNVSLTTSEYSKNNLPARKLEQLLIAGFSVLKQLKKQLEEPAFINEGTLAADELRCCQEQKEDFLIFQIRIA